MIPTSATPSLRTRIALAFLALMLAVQLAGFVLVRTSNDQNARRSIQTQLDVGARVFERLFAQNADTLLQGARILAADYGFREAVASDDRETIASALANHGARLGASLAMSWSTEPSPRAASGPMPAPDALDWLARLVGEAAERDRGRGAVLLDGHLHQVVVVPLKAPLTIGWVVLGFEVDRALASDLRALSGLQVSFVGGSSARAVLQRALDAALAPCAALQATLLALTAGGLLVSAIGSVATARRISRPLAALASAAERLGAGDHATPIPVLPDDEVGRLARTFDAMRTRLAEREARIARLAYFDSLTGLPNRVLFAQRADAALSADVNAGTVPMLDLTRFKHVNDVLGHAVGDRALQAVALRLGNVDAGAGLELARVGGDEFALRLDGDDPVRLAALSASIAAALQSPVVVDEHAIDTGAAIGQASWPRDGVDAATLLTRAGIAMYAAKRRRSGPLAYAPALDDSSPENLTLAGELRRAIERDELELDDQPEVALADGRVAGAEALVRWRHPERGRVPPDRLTLEVTESAIMGDADRALQVLDALHALGVTLSVDELGTGYSSLAYLKRLPVAELKIDRSFTSNMVADSDDATIVRSTVDLGHHLGLRVVAEGSEDEATVEALRAASCDVGQGWRFSKPLAPGPFADWVRMRERERTGSATSQAPQGAPAPTTAPA